MVRTAVGTGNLTAHANATHDAVNSQLPKSQLPTIGVLGVGSWKLGVDAISGLETNSKSDT